MGWVGGGGITSSQNSGAQKDNDLKSQMRVASKKALI